MSDDNTVIEEARRKPLTERVEHTLWKVRVEAFEHIKSCCTKIVADDDQSLTEFGPLLAKATTDTNAAALDKALEAMCVYLTKAGENHATRICDKTCAGIVNKCLNGRPGTVQKAGQVCLCFVELELADKLVDHMLHGFAHKVPKVVVAAIDIVHQAVSAFGTKVVPPQPILKALPPLFESRDAKTREKVKALVAELSRWVGAATVKTILFEKMRDAMKGDVEKLIEQAPKEHPTPVRKTCREQARLASLAEGQKATVSDDHAAVPGEEEVCDVFDLSEPRDILHELRKNWFEELADKKWSIRKQALSDLKDLASNPRLSSGDYGDVCRELKKVVAKDSNVQCVADAIRCMGLLAKGLRREYCSYARHFCPLVLEKFKEKNANVCSACHEALDCFHRYSFHLVDVQDDVAAALGHNNPKVKQGTLDWVKACVGASSKQVTTRILGTIIPAVAKLTNDPVPTTRENALAALCAICLKVGGTASIDKILEKVNESRRGRLQEMISDAQGGKSTSKQTASHIQANRPTARSAPKSATSTSSLSRTSTPVEAHAAKAAKSTTTKPSHTGGRATRPAGLKRLSGVGAKTSPSSGGASPGDDFSSLGSGALSKEAAAEKLTDLFGEDVVAQLTGAVWAERLETINGILSKVKDLDVNAHASTLVQGIAQIPGWTEKNFQVMSKQFELIKYVASSSTSITSVDASVAIGGLVEKVSDIKLKNVVFETLSFLCECVGPQHVFNQVHAKAENHKNPKILVEAMTWMSEALSEFGLKPVNIKSLLGWAQTHLDTPNAQIRSAVIHFLAVIHQFVGPSLEDMISASVKPALMSTIQQQFDRHPVKAGFVPTRRPQNNQPSTTSNTADGGSHPKSEASPCGTPKSFNSDDLLPRQDISGQITAALIAKLGSASWKERKEGLDNVEQLLTGAGNRIEPSVGDLFIALKARMADSNRNLTVQSLRLIAKIAAAMGRAIDKQGRILVRPVLSCLSDNKPQVRAAVLELLESWIKAAGPSILPDAVNWIGSPKCNADGKKDVILWMINQIHDGRIGSSSVEAAVKAAAIGCSDKSGDVRTAGNGLITQLLESFGNEVLTSARSVEGSLKTVAIDAIQKASGGQLSPSPSAASPKRSTFSRLPSPSRATPNSPSTSGGNGSGSRLKPAKSAAPRPAPKQEAVMDDGPLISKSDKKPDRARKNRSKRAKFDGVPHEEEAMLRAELEPHVSASLRGMLFAKDFKKHCTAADLICGAVNSLYNEIISCLDLIFRWSVIRICDAKTESLLHTLDMLKALFRAMISNAYHLSEYEATVLLPCVVEKSGHNQDRIRKDHRELMMLAMQVHSKTRVLAFIAEGLESKNNRTRIESVEEIGCIIDREGINIAIGTKHVRALPIVAKAVGERDKSLRAACLSTLATVYDFTAESIWQHLGRLTDQQQSLIMERLKYREKELAKSGVRGGYRGRTAVDQQINGVSSRSRGHHTPEEQTNGAKELPRRPVTPQSHPLPSPERSAPNCAPRSGFLKPPQAGMAGTLEAQSHSRPSLIPSRGFIGSHIPGSPQPAFDEKARQLKPPKLVIGIPKGEGFGAKSGLVHRPVDDETREIYPEGRDVSGLDSPSPIMPDTPIAGCATDDRPDDVIKATWARAMVTAHSSNMDEAIEALKILCHELVGASIPGRASEDTVQLLKTSADELVKELCLKLDQTFAEATAHLMVSNDPPSARGCKYTLNTLMQTFGIKWMAHSVYKQTLLDVISSLLQLLLDDRMPKIQEGSQLMRAMNVLMLKVMENANKTHLFECLLFLLRKTPSKVERSAADVQGRFLDLVVKCLIKTTKAVGGFIEELDLQNLLLAIHQFFVDLGVEEIRKRGVEDDKPLRMVKTILHEMCKIKGSNILDYIGLIPQEENPPPIICAYIDLNLTTLHNTGLIGGPVPRPSNQVDLGPYLSGTTEGFKACIERGINGIKTKHEWNVGTGKAHTDVLLHPSSQVTDGWLHKPEGSPGGHVHHHGVNANGIASR